LRLKQDNGPAPVDHQAVHPQATAKDILEFARHTLFFDGEYCAVGVERGASGAAAIDGPLTDRWVDAFRPLEHLVLVFRNTYSKYRFRDSNR
jgi:hypothetical protein